MRELLRCRVRARVAAMMTLSIASFAGQAAGIDPVLPRHAQLGPERNAGALPSIAASRTSAAPAVPVAPNRQNLLLDCGKIEQAQRGLNDARRKGARILPAAPAHDAAANGLPTRDELYHITRNQERFAALGQQFRCGSR